MHYRLKQRCLEVMNELIERPLSRIPMQGPTADETTEVVQRPQTLREIKMHLDADRYATTEEWYSNVISVYTSVMVSNPRESLLYRAASFMLQDFRENAFGLDQQNVTGWCELMTNCMCKLTRIISQAPISQRVDPFIATILRRAEDMPEPSTTDIAQLTNRINTLIVSDRKRRDVLRILFSCGAQPTLNSTIDVDLSALPKRALNALLLYVRAHALPKKRSH